MKPVKIVLLAFAVALSAGLALADTVPGSDPRIGLGAGGGTVPVGATFSFTSPTGSSPSTSPCVITGLSGVPTSDPSCSFQNESGADWFNLSFAINPVGAAGPFICSGGPFFANCAFNADNTQVLFFGPTPELGETIDAIPQGTVFQVVVQNWAANSTFAGTANVPEPGMLALFLTGAAALVAGRKLRRGTGSRV